MHKKTLAAAITIPLSLSLSTSVANADTAGTENTVHTESNVGTAATATRDNTETATTTTTTITTTVTSTKKNTGAASKNSANKTSEPTDKKSSAKKKSGAKKNNEKKSVVKKHTPRKNSPEKAIHKRELYAWVWLTKNNKWACNRNRGLTDLQKAAIVSTLYSRSGFYPAAINSTAMGTQVTQGLPNVSTASNEETLHRIKQYTATHSGTPITIGLAQWSTDTGDAQRLIAYANKKGKSWRDMETQLEFLKHTMDNKKTAAALYSSGFNDLPIDPEKITINYNAYLTVQALSNQLLQENAPLPTLNNRVAHIETFLRRIVDMRTR